MKENLQAGQHVPSHKVAPFAKSEAKWKTLITRTGRFGLGCDDFNFSSWILLASSIFSGVIKKNYYAIFVVFFQRLLNPHALTLGQ